MDGFPSLVPSRRRSSCRTALLFGIALWIPCVGIGCGDFTLFGDDDVSQAPLAVASADKATPLACQKETVNLDGTGSSDPDGDSLTYQWVITTRPTGSAAALQNATADEASFKPDKAGAYAIELTVEDEGGLSGTDSVTVTAGSGPVADAGADQQVSLGEAVSLDGGESVNPDEGCTTDGLSFSWSLKDPEGGESNLGTDVQATFTAEMEGTYTATLTAQRGSDSVSDEVEITAGGVSLESLEGGLYSFTVVEVNDGIFSGFFAALEGTTLDETVDIPSTDEVPADRTITLNLGVVASVDLDVRISRESAADEFYTMTGNASGSVSFVLIECALTAVCSGQLTPETTTTVTVSLTISDPAVTGAQQCSDAADEEGTIEVTLSGELQ